MLEVLTNSLCALIMTINGYYIIHKIINENHLKITLRAILYMLLLAAISVLLHPIQYTGLYTVTIFLLNIIIYKLIFKLSLEESSISCGLFMVILFFGDLVISLIFRNFVTAEDMRIVPWLAITVNILIALFCCAVINIKFIKNQIQKFYINGIKKSRIINIIFFILLVIGFSSLAYQIINSTNYQVNYPIDSFIMITFVVITYIFLRNKNNLKELNDEYDTLFSYIQTFEDWVEKEQLTRHEYKNQLAALRSMTKEKKVKDKIDSILEDTINVSKDMINQLKNVPKGGIKGLLYYKIATAEKEGILITSDVTIKNNNHLNKLDDKQIKTVSQLIGIYFDNAIEAAKITKEKNILLEMYEIKKELNIVISNSFIESEDFERRYEYNVSSKGKNRGKGLYFARKLLSDNTSWLTEKQEVVNNYYIQKIIIKLDK